MKTRLKMRCPGCGCWNTVLSDKILVEQKASAGTALAFTSDLSLRGVTSTNVYVTGVNFTAENVGTQNIRNPHAQTPGSLDYYSWVRCLSVRFL